MIISIGSFGGLEKDRLFWVEGRELSSLSTDPPGQLDVPGHDGDPLGVDGAQVGVLKQSNKVSLAGLLKSHDGGALEPLSPDAGRAACGEGAQWTSGTS